MNRKHLLQSKKGFTLVELIVVLVILAILASLLVPALTGYIDKAKQTQAIAEARTFAMAGKAEFAEWYGSPDKVNPKKGAQTDTDEKSLLVKAMAGLLKSECNMIPTTEAKKDSNRYAVVTSPYKKAAWDEFYQKAGTNRGANRGIFYIENNNANYDKITAIAYLSKDEQYVVRMIFDLDCRGTDFTEDDIGIYVQKINT